jgi:hypothetical protein
MVNDRSDGRGQISSRTIQYNALDEARNVEGGGGASGAGTGTGKDLFTIEEVKRLFDSRKIRLDRDALRLMWLLACLPGHGCLRSIQHYASVIFDFQPDLQIIKREHVIKAMRFVHGKKAVYIEQLTRRHLEASGTAAAIVA